MFTLIVPPESPCGCGSGRAFGDCCLRDGKVALSPKDINPPPPSTGQRVRKCLFAWTNNCGGGISGEHLISAAVLRQISTNKITITGTGFSRSVAINSDSLKVNRLCRRHNTSLGPLDTQAGRLFRAVQSAEGTLASGVAPHQRLYLFEGFDIERWLLKTLLAAYHARVSNVGPGTHMLPDYTMRLFESQLAPPFGLYVPARTSDGEQSKMTIVREASLHLITEGNLVAGIAVSLSGLELKLMIAGQADALQGFRSQHVFRPKFFNFYQGGEVVSIATAWTQGSNRIVWLSRGDPSAPVPEDP